MQRIKNELELLRSNDQLRKIPVINCKSKNKLIVEGIEYVNLASNDYLGLSTNLELKNEFLSQTNSR